jgi:hypothetical protein
MAQDSQNQHQPGTPDSVRCPRLARRQTGRSQESVQRHGYKSSDCPVSHQRPRPKSSAMNSSLSGNGKGVATIIHRTVRWCTGLSGEPTALAANGQPRNQRATRGPLQRSVGHTGLSGLHRKVSGAPTRHEAQRSAAPDMEGNCAPDMFCSCPVVHRTVRCTTRQKARFDFQVDLQRLLAALGLLKVA